MDFSQIKRIKRKKHKDRIKTEKKTKEDALKSNFVNNLISKTKTETYK